ncbi:unnamed protein product [Clonostachys chloroleuca]|uniref:Uncharacterized protein n=1 Tax=Clonostachys chloroleuca TaxID=1926264 RepID=A0AA35MH43_9HYPO|nr:unnamed protein product [Clonostachys chloroleuca]
MLMNGWSVATQVRYGTTTLHGAPRTLACSSNSANHEPPPGPGSRPTAKTATGLPPAASLGTMVSSGTCLRDVISSHAPATLCAHRESLAAAAIFGGAALQRGPSSPRKLHVGRSLGVGWWLSRPGELTYNETNQELREAAAMRSKLGLVASTENPNSSTLELRPYVDWQRERQDIGKTHVAALDQYSSLERP